MISDTNVGKPSHTTINRHLVLSANANGSAYIVCAVVCQKAPVGLKLTDQAHSPGRLSS